MCYNLLNIMIVYQNTSFLYTYQEEKDNNTTCKFALFCDFKTIVLANKNTHFKLK